MTYLNQEREEKMKTMANPQPFRISTTAKLTLPTATTLLLGMVAFLLLAAPPRPAQALLPGSTQSLAPALSVDKTSVVVNEGETVTNSGRYDDLPDKDADSVRVSASLGTVTQLNTVAGPWNWSYKAPSVSADETKTVTITARDSTGRYTTKSFSLTVNNLAPPVNDMFSGARDLATLGSSTTTGYTFPATMEAGEPRPYSSTKDCGIYGHDHSVWFKFTYGGQGGLPASPNDYYNSPNVSYNFDTKGSNFDTVLALYEGSSLGTLNQIECSNDNSLPNWNDELSIPQSKLTVGKTYYVQLTGTGGARYGRYQLHCQPCGSSRPTVMAWNIGKGMEGSLQAVADSIKALDPDIVLLNEVRDYPFNQAEWLAVQNGFHQVRYAGCARMGLHGYNGVAILSRYPITGSTRWDLPDSDLLDHWCMLKADVSIDGVNHHVFSTRFNWEQDNREQHEAAINKVRSMPSSDPVIFGGDFNANWIDFNMSSNTKDFGARTGLTDVFIERPDPLLQCDERYAAYTPKECRIDYIYYRGPYSVYQTQYRISQSLGFPEASGHGFVFTELVRRY